MSQSIADFIAENNVAPIDEFELAERIVASVEQHTNLHIAAFDLLFWRQQFNQILEDEGFEYG